eukprot:scaffold14.g1031.t1
MASFFAGASSLAGLGLGLGRPAAPADPASEMARLLNQYATHMLALENEAAAVRSKQAAAQQARTEAARLLVEAKELALHAERDAEAAAAETAQRERELAAKVAVNAGLGEEVATRRQEMETTVRLCDAQRASFLQECDRLRRELDELHAAHPGRFLLG